MGCGKQAHQCSERVTDAARSSVDATAWIAASAFLGGRFFDLSMSDLCGCLCDFIKKLSDVKNNCFGPICEVFESASRQIRRCALFRASPSDRY